MFRFLSYLWKIYGFALIRNLTKASSRRITDISLAVAYLSSRICVLCWRGCTCIDVDQQEVNQHDLEPRVNSDMNMWVFEDHKCSTVRLCANRQLVSLLHLVSRFYLSSSNRCSLFDRERNTSPLSGREYIRTNMSSLFLRLSIDVNCLQDDGWFCFLFLCCVTRTISKENKPCRSRR